MLNILDCAMHHAECTSGSRTLLLQTVQVTRKVDVFCPLGVIQGMLFVITLCQGT